MITFMTMPGFEPTSCLSKSSGKPSDLFATLPFFQCDIFVCSYFFLFSLFVVVVVAVDVDVVVDVVAVDVVAVDVDAAVDVDVVDVDAIRWKKRFRHVSISKVFCLPKKTLKSRFRHKFHQQSFNVRNLESRSLFAIFKKILLPGIRF